MRDGLGDLFTHNFVGAFGYFWDTTSRGTDTGDVVVIKQSLYGFGTANYILGQDYTGSATFVVNPYGYFTHISDESVKQDIVDVDKDHLVAGINAIKVRQFAYKNAPEVNQVGVIAQEVETVLPEAIVPVGDMKGVNTDVLVYALIAKVQELEERLAAIEKK